MRTLISLGQVCDVAFQLRMHSGDNTSHFFDWLATPFTGLIYTLENDFDVFYPEHLVLKRINAISFVQDEVTKISFFHHFSAYGKRIPESFLLEYPSFIEKFKHLAARFRETVKTKPVTLVRQNISLAQAKQLENVFFKLFPNTDVNFLYIAKPGQRFVTQHGRTVTIEVDELKKGFGNMAMWAQMLQYQQLITKPFQLSTVEVLTKDVRHHNFKGLGHLNRHSTEVLKIACQQAPNNPWFFYELALHHIAEKHWHQADNIIAQAIKLDKHNSEFYRVQLKTKANQSKIDEQQLAQELTTLFNNANNNIAICHDLVAALMKIKSYENALEVIDKILIIEPLNVNAYFNKAECLQKLNRSNFAELAIDKAITINPDIAHYYTLKSKLLEDKGQLDAAISTQEKAASLGGGFAVFFYYGNLLSKAGRFNEALNIYKIANEHNPNHNGLLAKKLQAEQSLKSLVKMDKSIFDDKSL